MSRSRGGRNRGGRRYDRDMKNYLARTRTDDSDYDGGYGTIGSQSMYYDSNADGSTNIFPDGMPSDHHTRSPHEHIIVNEDDGVEYHRDNDGTIHNHKKIYTNYSLSSTSGYANQ